MKAAITASFAVMLLAFFVSAYARNSNTKIFWGKVMNSAALVMGLLTIIDSLSHQ